jgi:hypothetical protein
VLGRAETVSELLPPANPSLCTYTLEKDNGRPLRSVFSLHALRFAMSFMTETRTDTTDKQTNRHPTARLVALAAIYGHHAFPCT